MQRTLILGLVTYALIIVGLATLERGMIALALPLLLYLGAGFVFAPRDIKLHIVRHLSADRIPHGHTVSVTLTVTNNGPLLENLLLEDVLPHGLWVLDGHAKVRTPLPAGATIELHYTLQGTRGYYQFQSVQVTALDSLGLFRKHQRVALSHHLYILPEVIKLPRIAMQPRRTRVYPGLHRARIGGPGVEFFGVREYQPGDSMRWINNRVSARQANAIYVNEFEQERAIDVGLILDARQKTNLHIKGFSLFEHTVQATTTLADTFLSQGNRVGLFICGRYMDWTFPGSGKIHRERILQALARADMHDRQLFQTLEHIPTRLFPPRSQLVLISPLIPEDLEELVKLRAHGYPLMVISPDPVDFEAKLLASNPAVDLGFRIARLERQRLLQKLGQMGVRLFAWQVDQPFHETAQVALNYLPGLRGRLQ